MRVVLVTDWHSPQMGYSDNFLPRALAQLGADVHLVTSDRNVYYTRGQARHYSEIFEGFLGPGIVGSGTFEGPDYTLHRLPSREFRGRIYLRGLDDLLKRIRPELVQCGEHFSLSTLQVVMSATKQHFAVTSECHVHASVFPLARGAASYRQRARWRWYRSTEGRLTASRVKMCFAISEDSRQIATQFLGLPVNKVAVRPLGVDTDIFHPLMSDEKRAREDQRREWGAGPQDVVAIYTGRISREKEPHVLAQAISRIRSMGGPFRAVFVGGGDPTYRAEIEAMEGCLVQEFVPAIDLGHLYRAADVGVWPAQESTSQLDAMACGLPLILSNRVTVSERLDGCGRTFNEGDSNSLAAALESLRDDRERRRMGEVGASRVEARFSWRSIAEQYLADYHYVRA